MENSILEDFGKMIIENVRDESIDTLEKEISDRINSYQGIQIRELLKDFNNEQIETILNLIPTVVDTSIHYFLEAIDSSENIKLLFDDKDLNPIDIKELSDGLAGELYSDEGWIAKFSKKPLSVE